MSTFKKIIVGLLLATQAFAGNTNRDVPSSTFTLKKISTPSNPASGYDRCYVKSDDKLYCLTSGGTETSVTGAGTGTVTSVTFTGDGTVLSSTPSSAVTTSGTVTASLKTQTANTFLAGPTSGSAATPTVRALTSSDQAIQTVSANSALNLGLSSSVASSALTIALKQNDGSTDASADNPVVIGFRNATATSGAYNRRVVTGALSIVVPSTATLGQVSAVDQYVWVYAIDNAGTAELAVSGVKLFADKSIASSTTISGSATSGTVLYSTTGRSNVPIRLIGRLLVNESTAGTWASAPSDVVVAPNPTVTTTDLVTYTPTWSAGFGTVSNSVGYWRRVGDTLEVTATCTVGTAAGTIASVSLPSGPVLDVNKLTINNTTSNPGVRVGSYSNSEVLDNTGGAAVTAPSTSTSLMYFGGGSRASVSHLTPATGTGVTASSVVFSVSFQVPISGWSTYGP